MGLNEAGAPTLEAIERRRLELWIVTTIVVAGVGAAVLLAGGWTEQVTGLPTPALRGGIVALALGFCAYAIEKEFHLRRLTRQLLDERSLTASLQSRVSELSSILAASRAMNSVLDLEEVLDTILGSSIELLGADAGSIMLAESEKRLRAVSVRGNPSARGAEVVVGEGIAGRVAQTREPVLITGERSTGQFPGSGRRERAVRSAMSIPLVYREELLGVLNVNAPPGRVFTEHELRALSVFAEQAAAAIANARHYQQQQEHLDRMLEVDRLKSEFIAGINHDLRTPLTMLLGGAALARREDVPEGERVKVLEGIERQARHLSGMIDALLVAADIERRRPDVPLDVLDVAALARAVAADFEGLDKQIDVRAPAGCRAVGEDALVRRVLVNLVENAFKHGAPPVSIEVTASAGSVDIRVVDRGPGIPPEAREMIFERFTRLDPARGRPGMGLGLSIVRTLIGTCDGTIAVEDHPDGGTVFRVSLDAAPEVGTVEASTERADRPAQGSAAR